jgi:DNA-binding PadR family transcriptional regulator
MDVLVLSSLVRRAMHGYELKLELQYKHVTWWAKCEHGHLYASLSRLEKRQHIRGKRERQGRRTRRVYTLTAAGRRWLAAALADLGRGADSTYFDIDLFLSGSFALPRERVLEILADRQRELVGQQREAEQIVKQMGKFVPEVAQLIMSHRVDHLAREAAFAREAARVVQRQTAWGSFLGAEPIRDFIDRTGVPLESQEPPARRRPPRPRRAPLPGRAAARR